MEQINYKLIMDAYKNAFTRTFFLDYEGTIAPGSMASNQMPDVLLHEILFGLTNDPKNQVVVLSDQRKEDCSEWFSQLPLVLVAESGGFFRSQRGQWQQVADADVTWKGPVRDALATLIGIAGFHGTTIAEGHFSIRWHYSGPKGNVLDGEKRQLLVALRTLSSKHNVEMHDGGTFISFSTRGINKGKFASRWAQTHGASYFMLAIGDDHSDEGLFDVIGPAYFTIKVGSATNSSARYVIARESDVIPFLKSMVDISKSNSEHTLNQTSN